MAFEGQHIGRYQIVRQLGSGSMGEVYLAEDARIGQQVALKVIRTEVSPFANPDKAREEERLFQREARAIAKLDHPYILPLYDYGEETRGGIGLTYLVMPYRPDGSLSDWLRKRESKELLPLREIAHIVGQTAEALQHAHNRDVIHQDVKPSNLLVRHRTDRAYMVDVFLADFGVAQLSSSTSVASQAIRGTPMFMAPEQWEGHAMPATDQYALAVMTYELLTGQPPFQGNLRRVMFQHLNEPPPPPGTVKPNVTKEVDAVILRGLAKKPGDRYPSISAFAAAFRQAAFSGAAPTPLPPVEDETMATLLQTSDATGVDEYYTLQHAGDISDTSDVRATLAISRDEAVSGTSRVIMFPGGKQVSVIIPAGVVEGQTIRVKEIGDQPESPSKVLLITISIVDIDKAQGASRRIEVLDTVITNEPAARVAAVLSQVAQNPITPIPSMPSVLQPVSQEPMPQSPVRLPDGSATPVPSVYAPPEAINSATTMRHEVPVPPVPVKEKRDVSRRAMLTGITASVAVLVAGGGVTLFVLRGQGGTATTPILGAMGTTRYTYHGHTKYVYLVKWSPDGTRIASGGDDKTVQVWPAFTGTNPLIYRGHNNFVYGLAWKPDNLLLASGSRDGTVQVWSTNNGNQLFVYRGHTNWVNTVDWSPDGKRIASGSNDKTTQSWDGRSGKLFLAYPNAANIATASGVEAVAWSPDNKYIAAGEEDGNVLIWSATDNTKPLITYTGHTKQIRTVAWSADGTKVASGGYDNTVHVWNALTGERLFVYQGHENVVNSVAWSHSGKYIASGSTDFSVQVWDSTTGKNVFTYDQHTLDVQNVSWSPDDKFIASGGYDLTVRVWSTGF